MASIASAPSDLIVATSDGIRIRFVGMELDATSWDGNAGLEVRLQGVRGAETSRRDAEFRVALDAWARRLTERGKDAAGEAPTMPGVRVLDRVKVSITDDVGTEYQLVAGQAAGDGTDWDAAWIYAPRPPATAAHLYLRFTLDGHPTGIECALSLR